MKVTNIALLITLGLVSINASVIRASPTLVLTRHGKPVHIVENHELHCSFDPLAHRYICSLDVDHLENQVISKTIGKASNLKKRAHKETRLGSGPRGGDEFASNNGHTYNDGTDEHLRKGHYGYVPNSPRPALNR